MFSIYTTIYLINKNSFRFLDNLSNFSTFAGNDGEVVIGTCEEGLIDGTEQIILDYIKYNTLNNVKLVISSDIKFSQNTFDGALKNFALQNTKYPLKLQMDFDEVLLLSQKQKWIEYGNWLLNQDKYKALFVPSIDLYGSLRHIRKNHGIGNKWRLHKEGLFRGVVNFAKLNNGLINTLDSDSSELIDKDNNLVLSKFAVENSDFLNPHNCFGLNNYIYTLHLGYLDLNYRQHINKNWWKEKWEDRSKKKENVIVDKNILDNEPTIEHNLRLE